MQDARRRVFYRSLICIAVVDALGVGLEPAWGQTAVVPPGTGTQADPYLISELGHLVWMGGDHGSTINKYYSLTADIDASATATWNDADTDESVLEGFLPIAFSTTEFRGVFEGNGHVIAGLTINRPAISQTLETCTKARLDADEDVDQVDFGLFQRCYRGAGVAADPACAG